MPYKVEFIPVKSGKNWAIKDKDNHIVGRSYTEEDAKSSRRARLAGAHGWTPKKR